MNSWPVTHVCRVAVAGLMADCFHTTFPKFILDMKLHINALELITIVVAVKLWGKLLQGKKIVINTDSSVSCQALNSGFSRDPSGSN